MTGRAKGPDLDAAGDDPDLVAGDGRTAVGAGAVDRGQGPVALGDRADHRSARHRRGHAGHARVTVPAVEVTVRVAVRVPVAVGRNESPMVQVPAAATAVVQPFVRTKSPGLSPVRVTALTASCAVPVLVTVTFCTAEVDPTTVVANAGTVAGFTVAALVPPPVPVRATVGLPAFVVTVSVPVRAPVAPGRNRTVTTHEPPAGTVAVVQVLVCVKSTALVPDTATALTVSGDVPGLVTVTLSGADVERDAQVPNARVAGLTVTAGARPVPDSGAVWVPALVATDRLAVRSPAAVGRKLTPTVQVPFGATATVQVFVCVNSPRWCR